MPDSNPLLLLARANAFLKYLKIRHFFQNINLEFDFVSNLHGFYPHRFNILKLMSLRQFLSSRR